jgi:zinc transporter ZupT
MSELSQDAASRVRGPATAPRPWVTWASALLPVAMLALLLAVFAFGNPLAMFTAELPPIEDLSIQRVDVTPAGFRVSVINGGPQPVTIAQVMVDDAYWAYSISPGPQLGRLETATIDIEYPWVEGEPNTILVVTNTGTTFEGEVPVAVETPRPGLREFGAYGLLGVYVGIIPVALGLMWFPAMKRMGQKWLGALLALTVGLLVFLLVDTLLEALEVAAEVPGVLQGIPLVFFSALVAWLVIMAVSARRPGAGQDSPAGRLWIAGMIALGIGLHNLGEGLAIGAAFALGEAALGSFLVIGFTLHNVTEGVGIAAPVTRDQPRFSTFVWLTLLAGAPAIAGAWIGGFAFSPFLATIFLGVGVGAIWQVIVEVWGLLRRSAEREGRPAIDWLNAAALVAGIVIMYVTAFLVK